MQIVCGHRVLDDEILLRTARIRPLQHVRQKSHLPSHAPAGCAMASNIASSIPCQSVRAIAAPCEDRRQSIETTWQTSRETCAAQKLSLSIPTRSATAFRQSKKSSLGLHPAVGNSRVQLRSDFFFHVFRALTSFVGMGISHSLYAFGVQPYSGLWHPHDAVVQVYVAPGEVHNFMLPHAGHEEGLEEHLPLGVRSHAGAVCRRLGLGVRKRSASAVLTVQVIPVIPFFAKIWSISEAAAWTIENQSRLCPAFCSAFLAHRSLPALSSGRPTACVFVDAVTVSLKFYFYWV